MKKSALEEVERKLYGKRELPGPPRPKPIPSQPPPPLPPPLPPPKPPMSPAKQRRLFWTLITIIVIGVAFAVFIFWRGFFGFSASRVVINIAGPEEVVAGEEVVWQVAVRNENRTALESGVLTFAFPVASLDPESGLPLRDKTETIERLEGRGETDFTFRAVVIGGDDFEKDARVLMRFRPEESALTLEKESSHVLRISRFPVTLDITGPTETIAGEIVPINLVLFNDAERSFGNLRVRMEYPSGFDFTSSQSSLSDSNRIWSAGEIVPSEEKTQEIFGSIWGSEGEGKIFRAFLEYEEPTGWTVYREVALRSSLAVVPLSLEINLTSFPTSQDGVSRDTSLTYELRWRNNFDVALTGIVLTAVLEGEMFDLRTLETTGTFSTARSEIRWSQAQIPDLGTLEPGEEGNVSFRIRTRVNFPQGAGNQLLTVRASISSETKPPGITVEKVRTSRRQETRINGGLLIEAFALYNETNRGFRNTGPYPLQVGVPTTFTVHWRLTRDANSFRNVRVTAILPSGIEWTDETSVTAGAGSLRYDPFTREVSWNISSLSTDMSGEAIFKVRIQPSPVQQGRIMSIISETILRADDTFTGNRFEAVAGGVDSTLPRDPAGSATNGRVQ